ncbi:DUF255 domain-containing protein [uncultured Pseudoteredinibacter sp.]|uniref:DUF255 domain-containing protein n=1 Tax=uncultured Pseudoteredinibacter sp. TaxID=1641701 RepID=UPI0026277FF4|nr:DUF255 domain-containing protein [uncultured Pseudoteredinibacter sp.]
MKQLILLFSLLCLSVTSTAEVAWQTWSQQTFATAKKQNKLILINVGLEGCTACNRMEQHTYSNPDVIKLLNEHFVSIAVDSQARPDIGERYSDWAWPATVFLMPNGQQVFAMAGNRFPHNFIPILHDLIAKQQAGTLQEDPDSPYAAQPAPVSSPLTMLRDNLRKQIDRAFNSRSNGWSQWGVNAETDGAKLAHLYLRAHLQNDKNLLARAINVSETFMLTLDPVWGGAYEANIAPGSPNVPAEFQRLMAIPEKRISNQSNALHAFALAYRHTQNPKYRLAIAEVDRFLDNWMQNQHGQWYANQKDSPPGLPADWWPQDYWLLSSNEERRRYGVPPVDHAVYADKNAEIILSYLSVYQALGEEKYLNKALRAAEHFVATNMTTEGWLLQTTKSEAVEGDERLRPLALVDRPLLIAQARFGIAFLKLYQQTADPQWLSQSKKLANAMLKHLYDHEVGGFWALAPHADEPIAPRKPLESNALAGQFFYQLHVLSKEPEYEGIAEATLRAVASQPVLSREGKATAETALLAELLTAQYVEFTVVSNDFTDQRSQALYQAGLDIYHPRKVIHYERPGRYPDLGEPVMFICNPNRCSLPLKTREDIERIAASY